MEDENDEDDYYSQGLYSVNEFTIDAAGDYKILSDYHFYNVPVLH